MKRPLRSLLPFFTAGVGLMPQAFLASPGLRLLDFGAALLVSGQQATVQTATMQPTGSTSLDGAMILTVVGIVLTASVTFLGFSLQSLTASNVAQVTAIKESTQTQVSAIKESTAAQVKAIESRTLILKDKLNSLPKRGWFW